MRRCCPSMLLSWALFYCAGTTNYNALRMANAFVAAPKPNKSIRGILPTMLEAHNENRINDDRQPASNNKKNGIALTTAATSLLMAFQAMTISPPALASPVTSTGRFLTV